MSNDINVLKKALELANKEWFYCNIAEEGNCVYPLELRHNNCIKCIIRKAEEILNTKS